MSQYTQLQNDVIDLLHDTEVTQQKVQDFIRRAEPKIERDLLDNRYGGAVPRQMLTRVDDMSGSDSTFFVPTDHLRTRSIKVGGVFMRYAAPEQVPSQADGYADADLTLDYYARLPSLSVVNDENWLLRDAYDTYVWATCLQYIPWGHEHQAGAEWRQWYVDAITSVKNSYQQQPRGDLRGDKTIKKQGRYTVIGDLMRFA